MNRLIGIRRTVTGILIGLALPSWAQEPRFRPPNEPSSFGLILRNTDTGAVVARVNPNSPAARIGFEPGDTLITVDGRQVGIVLGQVVDAEEQIEAATRRGRTAVVLLRNGRNGRLVNTEVRREFGGGGGITPPGPNPNIARQITEWYAIYLRREPTRDELANWFRQVDAGAAPADVENQILSSVEYYRLQGNDDARYIGALFRDLLRRDPIPPEGRNWLDVLKNFKGNRKRLVETFRQKYNR